MDLGERAYYSVVGKAVIGVIGGTLVLLATTFRSCEKQRFDSYKNEWAIERIETIRTSDSDTIRKFFSTKISDDSVNKLLTGLRRNSDFQWKESEVKYRAIVSPTEASKEVFTFVSKKNTNDTFIVYFRETSQISGIERRKNEHK